PLLLEVTAASFQAPRHLLGSRVQHAAVRRMLANGARQRLHAAADRSHGTIRFLRGAMGGRRGRVLRFFGERSARGSCSRLPRAARRVGHRLPPSLAGLSSNARKNAGPTTGPTASIPSATLTPRSQSTGETGRKIYAKPGNENGPVPARIVSG